MPISLLPWSGVNEPYQKEGWGTLRAMCVHAGDEESGSRADVSRQSSENGLTHEEHHFVCVLSCCSISSVARILHRNIAPLVSSCRHFAVS
jgi:hypothetical protein